MFNNFNLDQISRETDPNLSNLTFDAGLHEPAFQHPIGQQIYRLSTSRFGTAALVGAIAAAPDRPPVLALEPLLAAEIGPDAFTDEMKKLTGRIVRYIVEHLGGRWVARGIKISLNSRYRSGSIYELHQHHQL